MLCETPAKAIKKQSSEAVGIHSVGVVVTNNWQVNLVTLIVSRSNCVLKFIEVITAVAVCVLFVATSSPRNEFVFRKVALSLLWVGTCWA